MKIMPAGTPMSLNGPFSALTNPALPPRPGEALPYYGDAAPQPVQSVPVPAQAPSSGGGLLGGLFGQRNTPAAEPQSGRGGLFGTGFMDFNDPKTLIAMQLIANGSKAPGEMLSGIPQIAQYGQEMKQAQEEKAKAEAQQNKTLEWLRANRPDLVPMAEAGMVGEAFKMAMQKNEPKLMGVGGAIYNADTGEWITPPAGVGGSTEYGLNPQTAVDENGNPVLIQLAKDGTSIRTPLPEGVTLSKEPIKLDAGTHFVLLDPITRQPVGQIPKENYQEAYDTAAGGVAGKSNAEAVAGLGEAASNVRLIDGMVNDIKNDPDLPRVLGPLDSRTPNLTEGAVRVQAKIDQLSGQAFLQARQMLKGGGAITDFESNKAEQAFIRLNQAQSEADFKKALDDFNTAVQEGYRKLSSRAGGGTMPSTYEAAPSGTPTRRRYNPTTGELE